MATRRGRAQTGVRRVRSRKAFDKPVIRKVAIKRDPVILQAIEDVVNLAIIADRCPPNFGFLNESTGEPGPMPKECAEVLQKAVYRLFETLGERYLFLMCPKVTDLPFVDLLTHLAEDGDLSSPDPIEAEHEHDTSGSIQGDVGTDDGGLRAGGEVICGHQDTAGVEAGNDGSDDTRGNVALHRCDVETTTEETLRPDPQ